MDEQLHEQPALSVTELEAGIAQISSDIALQQEVLKNLECHKIAAQRQLNAIRDPIARLPLEISSEIFLGCLTSQRKPGAHIAPLLLLNICNAWTDIALSTPALWDTIRLHFPGADCLRSWLPRAGKRTLTIELNRGLDHSVAAVLSHYATQIKHLALREEADDELDTLAAAVESFPHLDTLIIDCFSNAYGNFAAFSSSTVREVLRLAPNLVELSFDSVEILSSDNSTGDRVVLSRLTSLKLARLKCPQGILRYLTTPALKTLILPCGGLTNAAFSHLSSPPLQELVLGYDEGEGDDFNLGEGLMQVPSLTHLELRAHRRSEVNTLFVGLQNLPSDSVTNLRTLIIRIQSDHLTIEPSWYHSVLRFLSPHSTTIAHFKLLNYSREPWAVVDGNVGEEFRCLVDGGVQVWIGNDIHNFLPEWLQPPSGMSFICPGFPKLIYLLDQ
ncbi:hypothetical protein B0H16DRAFT_1735282 [Mycena metata]|uniref:F-box domain-containing protein n=1 Tax=Mycena metata TaxID=1033252 RepID=A0AAD7HTI4_9AGAR|nr:hypothetical protein B0H16DRAFT_1735282 [Mycena metata]